MSTNYPLLRLTSSGGAITYARTSNFSTMALATGAASVTADFTLPALADGNYSLEVVTNAVASLPTPVEVQSGQLVLASLPTVNVTAPPGSTGSSPLVVAGTASGASPIHQVSWSNAATGATGTATGTSSWTASIGLAPGTNPITITATDRSGASSSTTFVVTYTGTGPAPSPASGGGGGGGCGCLGLEALLSSGLAALLRLVRRRPRGSPGDRPGRTLRETKGLRTPPT